LRDATFAVDDATGVVIDRDDVHRTCTSGPQWIEENFEAESGPAEEASGEADEEKRTRKRTFVRQYSLPAQTRQCSLKDRRDEKDKREISGRAAGGMIFSCVSHIFLAGVRNFSGQPYT
jgi:hypothetical protein